MSEILRPAFEDVRETMRELGLTQDDKLIRIYPLFHPERQVFRVFESQGADVILKVRKLDEKGLTEAEKIRKLVASYRFAGGHYPTVLQAEVGQRLAIKMPFLGHSLVDLSEYMDFSDLGYPLGEGEIEFAGFTADKIDKLVIKLSRTHMQFAGIEGLIHGDVLMPHRSPSNVVYCQNADSLLLIDGEALTGFDDQSGLNFREQTENLREWMHINLLAA